MLQWEGKPGKKEGGRESGKGGIVRGVERRGGGQEDGEGGKRIERERGIQRQVPESEAWSVDWERLKDGGEGRWRRDREDL